MDSIKSSQIQFSSVWVKARKQTHPFRNNLYFTGGNKQDFLISLAKEAQREWGLDSYSAIYGTYIQDKGFCDSSVSQLPLLQMNEVKLNDQGIVVLLPEDGPSSVQCPGSWHLKQRIE